MGFYFVDVASLRVASSSQIPHIVRVDLELLPNKLNSTCRHEYGFEKYDLFKMGNEWGSYWVSKIQYIISVVEGF